MEEISKEEIELRMRIAHLEDLLKRCVPHLKEWSMIKKMSMCSSTEPTEDVDMEYMGGMPDHREECTMEERLHLIEKRLDRLERFEEVVDNRFVELC